MRSSFPGCCIGLNRRIGTWLQRERERERERVVVVMDSADQLIIETKAFHQAPPVEATVLMQHILSIKSDVI